MDVTKLQQALAGHGIDPGAVDGAIGPKTYRALVTFLAGRDLGGEADGLAAGMAQRFGPSDINSRLRICNFLAQASEETGGFRFLTEQGGDTYFAQYDGREDLGNTEPGDGARYRGRGIFMITGRANYREYGRQLGLDLEGDPNQAASPAVAVATASFFWEDHGLNALADAGDLKTITRRINGGFNGLAQRQGNLNNLLALWPE